MAQLRRQRGDLRETIDRNEGALAGADQEAAADGARLEELQARLGGERSRLERAREQATDAERRLRAAERALAGFRTEYEEFRGAGRCMGGS